MKKAIIYSVLGMWLSTAAFAQESVKLLDNLGVSLKASPTLGYGLEVSSKFHKKLILRTGLHTTAGFGAAYSNCELEESDELLNSFGYIPYYRAKRQYAFTHGNILMDFHPGGILHITADIFIGTTKFKYKGFYGDFDGKMSELLPGKDWPSVDIDGVQQMAFNNGRAEADFRRGNAVKPYLGLGLGRAVPRKKMSFKFEVGVLYQGDSYKARQNGIPFDSSMSAIYEFADMHDMLNEPLFKFWPQINFQLSYRLF